MHPENAAGRLHPIYIVLDVSQSMWKAWRGQGPHTNGGSPSEAFMSLIPNTLMALTGSPMMQAVAWVSVLAFSDRPQVLQPIRSLAEAPVIAEPRRGVQSDYDAILRFLLLRFRQDARVMTAQQRSSRPVVVGYPRVLFITDGAPFVGAGYQYPQRWQDARDRLVAGPSHALLATIGLPGSCEPVLWRLATGDDRGEKNAFLAHSVPDPDGLAATLVASIEEERSRPDARSALLRTPAGMRRIRRSVGLRRAGA
ncbi:MAG: hypothetical protein QOE23_2248 [Pseudonocardiales bacterium]|nr:hypothetical protein [Pseudonocardiales bacterium]